MKKSTLFLFLLLFAGISYGQKDMQCIFDFETNPGCLQDKLWIDTISNPNNIWQIGQPHKAIFNSANSLPNAIVTKLDTCYPPNDTSSFIFMHLAEVGLGLGGVMYMSAGYKVNSDTINDYGILEFSPNNGITWINMITDTIYAHNFYLWITPKPVFSGNSYGWKYFEIAITDMAHFFNIHYGDTVLWRYTFISDSIQTYKEGWMLDDVGISDLPEGIPEISSVNLKTQAFPNPAAGNIDITFENPDNSSFTLIISDELSRTLIRKDHMQEQKVSVNISSLKAGMYYYNIFNAGSQGRGRFVVER